MWTICGWVDITDYIPPDNEDNGSGQSSAITTNASLSDPNSTWDFTVDDINQTLNIKNFMPVIVFDENAPAIGGVPTVPAMNFAVNVLLENSGGVLAAPWSEFDNFGATVWDYSVSGAPKITVNNNVLGNGFQIQDLTLGNIVAGVEYMFSIYQQGSGTISNFQSVMWIQWYDQLGNQIGPTITDVRTPTLSQVHVSLSAVAPANTVSAIIFFGGQTTVAGSNSGSVTFETVQFEPMWFVNRGVSYPTPDCNAAQVNSVIMPDGTTSRACRRFAGYVEDRVNSYVGTQRHTAVQCASSSKLLETVGLISASFTATQDTSIITTVLSQVVNNTSFISQLATGQQHFFGPSSTLIPGVIIDSISWNNATLRQVLNDLGSQSGSLYYVDAYYYLWYVPPSFAGSTIMLSDTPDNVLSFPYSNFSVEYDSTNPVNVAMVVGSKQKAAVITEPFSGNGTQTVFNLQFPPDNVHGLSVGGVSVRAGVAGVDDTPTNNKFGPSLTYKALINKQTKALTFATAPASGSGNISISYTYEDQVISQVFAADAIAEQSCQFWGLVNDSAITSTTAAKNRGLAELASYAYERTILTFDLLNIYMPIGSLALFTNQSEGFTNAPFVIQTVQSDLKGGGQDNWQYTAGVYNPTIIDHLRNATKAIQKSPTTANVVVIASIDVALFDSLHVNDSISATVSNYASAVGVDSPNAYWRLGETFGTTAHDISGNGYNGTIASGVTLNQTGALVGDPNTSMLFNGTTGYVSTPINFSGATAQTLECWVKPSNLTYASFPRFMANDNNGGTTVSMFLGSNPAGAGLFFHVGNGTATAEATTSFQLSTTAWTHVVGTWDGTTLTIYVNGSAVGTNTLSGALGTTTFTMDIGKETHSGNAWWPGYIDEVAVYPVALSAARVLAHYNAGI